MQFGEPGPVLGLFGAAFLAATMFPAQSELLLAYLLRSGADSWWLLLVVATAGNVLGSVVNWYLGRLIDQVRHHRWFPIGDKALERAERWYLRWGKWSLLLSWAPIVGDPLTMVAGMLRLRLLPFLALVALAKGSRYGAVALMMAGSSPA